MKKIKKILAVVSVLLCTVIMFLSTVNAVTYYEFGDFKLSKLSDNRCEIAGFSSDADTEGTENLILPSSLGKYIVTSVSDNAFANNTYIKNVQLSSTVTNIGGGAFSGNTLLNSIELYNVETLGGSAFYNCTSLNNIVFTDEKLKNINHHTFAICTSLNDVELPYGIEYIGEYAFYKCSGMKYLFIPKSVTYISPNAFEQCNNLVIYTDNDYAKNYAKEHSIMYKTAGNKGDVDLNGSISLEDAVILQKALARSYNLNKSKTIAGDMDSSGNITLEDSVMLQKMLAGISVL